MNFIITKNPSYPNSVILQGEGIELWYIQAYKTNGLWLVRSTGTVQGYHFSTDEKKYWKKDGRGGMRNKDGIWNLIREADGFMVRNGFAFWT